LDCACEGLGLFFEPLKVDHPLDEVLVALKQVLELPQLFAQIVQPGNDVSVDHLVLSALVACKKAIPAEFRGKLEMGV
jgi:hypothetical protein